MERRDVALLPPHAIERVIVIETDVGDAIGAEDGNTAIRQRRFAGAGVADEAQHDGTSSAKRHGNLVVRYHFVK
jgi:hypothetical protein